VPTRQHPDSGAACPTCEHVYGRHEGIKTGRGFVFGHAEIARLFLRLGEGMSLRAASHELRDSIFRSAAGSTSRQTNLAVNYLDAFAPAVIAALHPTCWPRVLVLDARTLFTRAYRPARGRAGAADADESWVGTLEGRDDPDRPRRDRPASRALPHAGCRRQGRRVLEDVLRDAGGGTSAGRHAEAFNEG
jgi:hypothetical protein